MSPPIRPSECPICQASWQKIYRYRLLHLYRHVKVQTWCRLCGLAEILGVPLHYKQAVAYFQALDEQPASHQGHEETGGWGVHWRLDDVLRVVFPGKHREDLWPKPAWYGRTIGDTCDVEMVTEAEIRIFHPGAIDRHRSDVNDWFSKQRMSRIELERFGEVWDEDELEGDFEVLGQLTPFVMVRRRDDGIRGSVIMQEKPLYFFAFDTKRVL